MNDYDDIINLPYRKSTRHAHMSNYERAAQFAPFAALTGYDECVKEAGRITDQKEELTDAEESELNENLRLLIDTISEKPCISVEYFIPDLKKQGGRYETYHGMLRRIDEYEKVLIFTDEKVIPITDVKKIEIQDNMKSE